MTGRVRYDGLAAWYDGEVRSGPAAAVTAAAVATASGLLGAGPGRCLDLGCGTGVAIPTLAELGWEVVGVDLSADQLRVAQEHVGAAAELYRADAARLPFADASFDAVVSLLVHTDLDDLGAAYREAARVLRPGGASSSAGSAGGR